MMPLALGLLLFLGVHLLPTQPDLRDGLVARFGATTYRIAFSLLSAVGLLLIAFGYHKLQVMPGKNPQIWTPPTGMRHVAAALMLPSLILLAAAYIPSRIRDVVRHPMLAAIKLWATAHLLANGDLGGMLLFGSFLAWAVYDRISLKTRSGGRGPLGNKTGGVGGDIAAIVVGVVLYAALILGGHMWLIGKAPLPIHFAP